jgi:hypothetical protein
MGAGGPWAEVEVMADSAHGFDAKEIIAKIGFHKNNKKNGSDMELAQSSYYLVSNVLYSTSPHTRSYTG